MTIRILTTTALLILTTGLTNPAQARADQAEPLKVVVHVNFDGADRQAKGLKNVENLLKEAPDTQVEVVCHGLGINLVVTAHSESAEAVQALISRGVQFSACENTMRQKSIQKEDLLPGVGTVPSGAAEVVRRQQRDGYAYFKP
ncbi:MAG TPA: DsrE family protein [Isosphaeraceae bacterium]|nr:DsrE family protein [Isosphaeraceae bacterium]